MAVVLLGLWWQGFRGQLDEKAADLKNLPMQNKVDSAQAASEDAKAANAQIAVKLTNRADILTPESRSHLIERLKKLPAKSVFVFSSNETPESGEFAGVIIEVLKESGCFSGRSSFENVFVSPHSRGRVVIHRLNEENEADAKTLESALIESGIPDVVLDPSVPTIFGRDSLLQITIKAK